MDVSNLTLSGDQAGGLELSRVSDSHVHNITTTDEPVGVSLHNDSTNLVLDAISLSGGHTGVLADKTTTSLRFTGLDHPERDVVGMAYDGRDALLADSPSPTAARPCGSNAARPASPSTS